ncbi:ATP-dependent DNA helicase PIF6 [Eumeta japonica]|uniref:ATP-dependent DNA helicase PIF6 n=1 Tax=Eumeta variegata TaxID=151549 RepID=A0A4C1ZYE1_EUMVA|nr:ATP-dependent DNA helicase PIF6 [Eumeta japonica]
MISERLNFIKRNQKKLRAEDYIHLRDAVVNDGHLNASNIGQHVILPSSFTGSPRFMNEKSQDAMTYVRKFGRPDLFITFTCNPEWPEIKRKLALAVASSGIAATLLAGGRTAHSTFKLPLTVSLEKDSVCSIRKNGPLGKFYKTVKVGNIEELITKVYPDISQIENKDHQWMCQRAILAARNSNVDEINDIILSKLPGDIVTYTSIDTVMDQEDVVNYPQEFLNSLNPSGLPPHSLNLKIGAPIILLRNLKPPNLCNGTRLQVKFLRNNVIVAIVLTGPAVGQTVLIPRIPMIPNDLPFNFKRIQFPIKLSFAVTINKSQGQTFKHVGIDLRQDCFSHGQLYVALSRSASKKNCIQKARCVKYLGGQDTAACTLYKETDGPPVCVFFKIPSRTANYLYCQRAPKRKISTKSNNKNRPPAAQAHRAQLPRGFSANASHAKVTVGPRKHPLRNAPNDTSAEDDEVLLAVIETIDIGGLALFAKKSKTAANFMEINQFNFSRTRLTRRGA